MIDTKFSTLSTEFSTIIPGFSIRFKPFQQSFQQYLWENFITERIFCHEVPILTIEFNFLEEIMIKGVNKKVLEINNPQSVYFEKAVLYLKPNMNCVPEQLLKREADEFIRTISPKSSKYVLYVKLLIGISIAFSAVSAALVLLISFF